MSELQRGEPCGQVHVTHPCEGCGRVAAAFSLADVHGLWGLWVVSQELLALLEEHMPPWYTAGHYKRAKAAIDAALEVTP